MDSLDDMLVIVRFDTSQVRVPGVADVRARVQRRRARRRVVFGVAASACAVATSAFLALDGSTAPKRDAARNLRLGPGSCSEVFFGTIGGSQDEVVSVTDGEEREIGVFLRRGSGTWLASEVRIDVFAAPTGSIPAGADTPVRSVRSVNLTAGDHDVTVNFDGRDDDGNVLPAGRYDVHVLVRSEPAPGSACALQGGGSSRKSGTITTVDWAG